MESQCMDSSNSPRWPATKHMSPTTAVLALRVSKWAAPLAGTLSFDEVRNWPANIKARRATIGHDMDTGEQNCASIEVASDIIDMKVRDHGAYLVL